jgi:membrane protease YdiL (CAAX protease family)
MTSPIEPRTPRLYHVVPPRTALMLTGALVLAMYAVQIGMGIAGLPAILAIVVADVVAIAMLWGWRVDVGLRRPRPRFAAAAVLTGAGCWYLAAKLVDVVSPPGDVAIMRHAIDKGPLIVPLLGLGLMPAIAEELVFRGVLARSFARKRAGLAVLVSAVAFSAYHIAPAQMLGTLPLAFALGILAVRSGSVVPGMIAHLVNNTIVIVLERDELPALARGLTASPAATFAGAAVLVTVGLALAVAP